MKLPQTGGCLCGAIRYEITQPPLVTYTCHCTVCQRLTGSAFSSALVVPAEACRFRGRAAVLPAHRRQRPCGDPVGLCGVRHLALQRREARTAPPGTFVAVRAGTLDDTSWLRPTAHFWTRSAQPWVTLPEGDTRFETQPADGLAWLHSARADQRRSGP